MPADSDTGAALLRAVLEAPDDDAPRLVYADWLDEQGDPARAARADLIRRMVALPTYVFTRDQSPDLRRPLHGHKGPVPAMRHLQPLLSAVGCHEWGRIPEVHRVTVRRGFAEAVVMPPAAFVRLAGWLFAAHPLTRVELADLTPVAERGRWAAVLEAEPARPNGRPQGPSPEDPGGSAHESRSAAGGSTDLSRAAVLFGRRAAGLTVVDSADTEAAGRGA